MERYPPASQIAAPSELREAYERARAEIANYKAAANAANVTARDLAKDKNKYKSEATIASRQLLQISKRQKASDEAKKSGVLVGRCHHRSHNPLRVLEGRRLPRGKPLGRLLGARGRVRDAGVLLYDGVGDNV